MKHHFSLLEILIALIVLSIGITGLLTALGQNSRNVAFLRNREHALRIAADQMRVLRRADTALEEPEKGESGIFEWEATMLEHDPEELPIPTELLKNKAQDIPMQLQVTVRWPDYDGGEMKNHVQLSGYRLVKQVSK